MPDTTTTTPAIAPNANGTLNVSAIAATALSQRNDEVTKEVVKKLKVIAKRQAYIQNHLDGFNKKVAEFQTALEAAATPEAIMAVLEAHKFPASVTKLCEQA